jgi:heme-degrading monooxygenase HmoA
MWDGRCSIIHIQQARRRTTMVKVLIKRETKKETEVKVHDSLVALRAAAMRKPGYVSGETLVNTANPREILVISTWLSLKQWKAWQESKQRMALDDALRPFVLEEQVSTYYIAAREE